MDKTAANANAGERELNFCQEGKGGGDLNARIPRRSEAPSTEKTFQG